MFSISQLSNSKSYSLSPDASDNFEYSRHFGKPAGGKLSPLRTPEIDQDYAIPYNTQYKWPDIAGLIRLLRWRLSIILYI